MYVQQKQVNNASASLREQRPSKVSAVFLQASVIEQLKFHDQLFQLY